MNTKDILKENKSTKKLRALKVYKLLKNNYPEAKCGLSHQNPFELFVAVPLSAQTTDIDVNKVTKELFKIVKNPNDLANLKQVEVEKIIHSLGFFRQKAKNLITSAKIIVEKFEGKIPNKIDELITLPGIARKSANIILESGFGIIEGIAVDTHVKRISNLLFLTKNQNPDKIEKDLCDLYPRKYWGKINHLFINHGRNICIAKRPKCDKCVLFSYCSSKKQT